MERYVAIEEMRRIYGPEPPDPGDRSRWEHTMELLADLPNRVAELVASQGTDHVTLAEMFGQTLPLLEADISWYYLVDRTTDRFRPATILALKDQPWVSFLHGVSAVKRNRVTNRLADDTRNNVARIAFGDPGYRAAWLSN